MRLVRSPLAAAGVVLTSASALLFLFASIADALGWIQNPYVGILVFGALPLAIALGLVLIPIGNLRARRRGTEDAWPVIDLRKRGQRVFVMSLLVATAVNVGLFAVAGYGAVHYMETPSFCGQVCHAAMAPEYVGHAQGPHANVTCVSCHVGEGTGALVQSKIDGSRRLVGFVTGGYERPIPTPVHGMRPAREICTACHWPEKVHGDKLRVIKEYGDDEASTETVTTLEMRVGGGSAALGIAEGIHWHMNIGNEVEYVALDDKRQDIPYVKVTGTDGAVREYRKPGVTDEALAKGTRRRMDCTDCHSRPSHTFAPTTARAVDQALALSRAPRTLPFVRREMVKALDAAAAAPGDGPELIGRQLRAFYAGGAAPAADVDRAVATTVAIYDANVFPAMRVSFGTYRNELGHIDSPGCFRCHDEEKATADGRKIGQDCESCHRIRQ